MEDAPSIIVYNWMDIPAAINIKYREDITKGQNKSDFYEDKWGSLYLIIINIK